MADFVTSKQPLAVSPAGSSRAIIGRIRLLVAGIVALLIIGAIAIFIVRSIQSSALAAATELHAKQYVTTVRPTSSAGGLPLTLPGTLQGINEATVYARGAGYIQRWMKDIGASVKQGEVLAEIAAPEIDEELSQAVAAEQLAASSEGLAKSSAERWQGLRAKDAVTQQELDERLSAYKQAQATLASARANVERLRKLQGFNKVVAPFNGVITSRNIDVGDLVDAGNGGAGKALFTIAQVDPLRLYVYVPQAYAQQVKVGDMVTVTMSGGAAEYQGTVARTARAIDTATRTMQVEIQVPNPKGALIAGSYVQAELPIKQDAGGLLVPTNVLLFRPTGPQVAIVGSGGRVHLSTVKLGTDYGTTVAVLSGLAAADALVLNPADSLAEGDVVAVTPSPAGAPAVATGA